MHIWGTFKAYGVIQYKLQGWGFFLVLTVAKCVKASEVGGALQRQMYEQPDSW